MIELDNVDDDNGEFDNASDDSDNSASVDLSAPQSILRIIADDYDQAQRVRVAKGEQIRAIVQGRDTSEGGKYLSGLGFHPRMRGEKIAETAADALLKSVLRGESREPHSYLADAYRRAHESERSAFKEMSRALIDHPAWEWMGQVRGVGPTLGAKLLSRLDIDKAQWPSSFWQYCGLGTVPGQRWQCAECGWVGIFPSTYAVTGKHKGCKRIARVTHINPDGQQPENLSADVVFAEIRAAQPKAAAGEKRPYDSFAKKTLYLLGTAWLKSGARSYYNGVYRNKIVYYDRERPGWEKGRKHYSALRVAEKLFLSHLHEAWLAAVGRDARPCYAETELEHGVGIVRADEVLEWEGRAE